MDFQPLNKLCILSAGWLIFKNPNGRRINRFFMIDLDDITNQLSKNLSIINIDIASCFDFAYNKTNLKEVSTLERISGMMYTEYLEDISKLLGSDLLTMKEKEQFLNDIKEKSKDKDILEAVKFEDSIEYRFELVKEAAYEEGIEEGIVQGIEQGIVNTIKNMLNNNYSIDDIAKITKKTHEEIIDIKNSIENK